EGGIIDGVPHATQWIFLTEDDGKTWVKKWQSGPKSFHHLSTLDQQLKELWLITDDTLTLAARKLKKYNLWKSQIKTKVKPEFTTTDVPVVVSPNPALDVVNISINGKPPQQINIAAFDITGRLIEQIYAGSLKEVNSQIKWEVPHNLPSGIYVLHITIDGEIYIKKVIIAR
ncbi:MAG TPA: T9SS type A sorting domain-containing protein, partial [Candidatus Kapabacteria bacterium]